MTVIKGGYVTYGEKIGILMLDTVFPRIHGDMGNASTFPFPVKYKVVNDASVVRVVKEGDVTLIEPFIKAAKELEEQGVQAITTCCGFLALFQKQIQTEVNVPFYSSSLMQIPFVYNLIGQKGKIGVLTARKETLTFKHFEGAGVKDIPLAIEGMDDMSEFNRSIIEGNEVMDVKQVEQEVLQQAKALIENHHDIRAIVLECTNLTPYIEDIKRVTQLPVFDILTLTKYVHNALR
ncbi:aspartate/glutamate racemase family protein [Jeotgalibacillus marinus]|uniref:Aspartate/glutamate racemase family protein n=1 Tax=Jeotgalibacillus marinus TaxID=86667 RepID=A0ABV3Q6X9_9BACL